MESKMTAEMRVEFERENADRAAHGEPLIDEARFVFVWKLDEQIVEREELKSRDPQGYVRARAAGKM